MANKKPLKHLKAKLVVIINGQGGTGKDTVCEIAEQYYCARTVSAITPVKKLARQCGWDGAKDNRARKFLSDLKRLLVDYNDLPNKYLEQEYAQFLLQAEDLLFVHIREGDQIDAFKSKVTVKCLTLLVKSGTKQLNFGNPSDDQVEKYQYDYYFNNDQPLELLEKDFITFLEALLEKEGLE